MVDLWSIGFHSVTSEVQKCSAILHKLRIRVLESHVHKVLRLNTIMMARAKFISESSQSLLCYKTTVYQQRLPMTIVPITPTKPTSKNSLIPALSQQRVSNNANWHSLMPTVTCKSSKMKPVWIKKQKIIVTIKVNSLFNMLAFIQRSSKPIEKSVDCWLLQLESWSTASRSFIWIISVQWRKTCMSTLTLQQLQQATTPLSLTWNPRVSIILKKFTTTRIVPWARWHSLDSIFKRNLRIEFQSSPT